MSGTIVSPHLRALTQADRDRIEAITRAVGLFRDDEVAVALEVFDEAVGEFEKRFIKRVLDRVDGNQSRAAHMLGIHRNTLSRKLSEYKLDHRRNGNGR